MNDLSEHGPLERFDGLAEGYAQHRPDYPAEALAALVARVPPSSSALAVDLGSGTGISSRLLAARGYQVVGIEPNAEMRAEAERHPGRVDIRYRDGRAERTGLAEGSASLVLAAQAFHWFESERALKEIHRILKPEGWIALMWNERDESDPFTHAFGEIIRALPEAKVMEPPRRSLGEVLHESARFHRAERLCFPHAQSLSEAGLLGRALSMSYAPREPEQQAPFLADLRKLFHEHQQAGRVILRYETLLHVAEKRGE